MVFDMPPDLKAPSIALQRIVLVVFLAAVCAMMLWQHRSENSNYLVRIFTTEPLPDAVVDLDFGAAEAAWSELSIDAEGALEINAQTDLALSEVIALMSDDAFDIQLDRMAVLIDKQLGADISQQFAELLPSLKEYKEVEEHWWAEHGNDIPPPFSKLFQLQNDVLGEALAGKLFSEQRQLAEIMLAGYRIQTDAALSQAEKDQAMMDLHSGFHVGNANDE